MFKLRLHTSCKFFSSNFVGVDESYPESWMGHKGKYLDESYFRAEEEKHVTEYRKTIQHLASLRANLKALAWGRLPRS